MIYTDLKRETIDALTVDSVSCNRNPKFDGFQWIVMYENGYGMSIVKFFGSKGNEHNLWELAVIKDDYNGGYHLTMETDITDDVIGWLDEPQLIEYSKMIRELEKVERVIRFFSGPKQKS